MSVDRRTFLVSGLAGITIGTRGIAAMADPSCGTVKADFDARFQPVAELMTSFLKTYEVPGAAVAVTQASQVVFVHGFGLADPATGRQVQADSLFRIASISKPITAVAILQLVDRGRLQLDTPWLDVVADEDLRAAAMQADPRHATVTVRQLLQHTAGWFRSAEYDPIARPWHVAETLGIAAPPNAYDVVRFSVRQKLGFEPGTKYVYSNVGYLCLGLVLERLTGQPYETVVRENVLSPLGITRMRLGRALPECRPAEEVAYVDSQNRRGRCLYAPRQGIEVPQPDGADNVEGFGAHGGWIASAVDLVKFASAFDHPSDSPLLSSSSLATMFARPQGMPGLADDGSLKPYYYGLGWNVRPREDGSRTTWHNGSIPGTSTILVRRYDGMSWAILFNSDATRDQDHQPLSTVIDPEMHRAIDAVLALNNEAQG